MTKAVQGRVTLVTDQVSPSRPSLLTGRGTRQLTAHQHLIMKYLGSRLAPKGFMHVHHLFLPRAAHALAATWQRVGAEPAVFRETEKNFRRTTGYQHLWMPEGAPR